MRVSERWWWRFITCGTAWLWRCTGILQITVTYLPVNFFIENRAVYEIMSKNTVERDSLQTTVWRMPIEFWITKVTDTHSEYVILIAFPLQQWFHDHASMLGYKHTVSLVSSQSSFSRLRSTWMTSGNSAVWPRNTVSEVESHWITVIYQWHSN
jgi:hypothetical protein